MQHYCFRYDYDLRIGLRRAFPQLPAGTTQDSFLAQKVRFFMRIHEISVKINTIYVCVFVQREGEGEGRRERERERRPR